MNHIYKVIFNKATGTFMAVAEYAKSHSTGGSCATGQVGSVRTLSFARIAALAVLVIGATLNGSAYAGKVEINTKINNGAGRAEATGDESIAIGGIAQATGSQAIAIGSNQLDNNTGKDRVGPKAIGSESIAIGGDVSAEGDASIAIGSDDLYLNTKSGGHKHTGDNPINKLVQGHKVLQNIRDAKNGYTTYRRTKATGHASTAVGAMSYAKGHFSNAFGTYATSNSAYSLAVGLAAKAEGESAIAVGSDAQTNGFATTAIGGNTKVELGRGVALGYGSQINTNDNNHIDKAYTPPDTTDLNNQYKATTNVANNQKTKTVDIFSIGSSSIKRRIIHVGAGVDHTDAVNVAQLNKVVEWARERKITFMGDDNSTTDVTLDQVLNIKGGKSENDGLTNNNIGVVKDSNNGLKVKLAKDLTGLTSVSAATKITVGNGNPNAELQSDNLTFTQTTGANSGKTIYGHDGVKFTDNPNAGTAAAGTTRITRNR
ncbi:ESPR-type extended signal peptide-containing protein, partial [Moraxella catarrhalis]|uniref:ESPR-type extended signal peptide-containing protein n=1 Tax=Moraxella catarrhalis TaxID=480 RepID=UPI0012C77BD1